VSPVEGEKGVKTLLTIRERVNFWPFARGGKGVRKTDKSRGGRAREHELPFLKAGGQRGT